MKNAFMVSLISVFMDGTWDLGNFLKNATSTLKGWGGLLIMLIGVVMVIVSVYKIASGLISHGKKQTNWAVAIILLILGGAFIAGGWDFVSGIAKSGEKTINDLGEGDPEHMDDVIIYGLRSLKHGIFGR